MFQIKLVDLSEVHILRYVSNLYTKPHFWDDWKS